MLSLLMSVQPIRLFVVPVQRSERATILRGRPGRLFAFRVQRTCSRRRAARVRYYSGRRPSRAHSRGGRSVGRRDDGAAVRAGCRWGRPIREGAVIMPHSLFLFLT